ncbi:Ubiquitin carboxyl-terminal hydrolase isozyme L5 [Mycena sanguinolenta]|uniref:ubiquitinyl hydrolase 1 n=1 Tax=Mycena sanguinolenta TaxID=230812 RepID=A0A8H6XS75_9AGAR|nr:Ubiquitin carboxyl-terminal hydrolase isozyme L5 [Mycena sanguinolenta]
MNGSSAQITPPLDLVGEPLGIHGLELVELYDIEPWAVDHLNPRGLVFCFMWRKDAHKPSDFDDPAAERVWFANQLSDEACGTLAIINIALNCLDIEIGEELSVFKQETESMSPVMKGLAISNSPFIRKAHRSLARPPDLRGALNTIATSTLDGEKKKKKPPTTKRTPARASTSKPASSKGKAKKEEPDTEEAYHFIGYVPAYGKVWELDGLKSGPLEVGELSDDEPGVKKNWMDVVRPALRLKMQKYGGTEGGNNIRFSLLALVDGLYEQASDTLEMLKRDRKRLQGRMKPDWESLVDSNLLEQAKFAFDSPVAASAPGRTFAPDFGSRRMARDLEILEMPERALVPAWEQCVRDAVKAKVAVEDEVAKATRANTEHVKRTHDYEPFFREFVTCLQDEGLLEPLLDVNNDEKTKTKRVKLNGKG